MLLENNNSMKDLTKERGKHVFPLFFIYFFLVSCSESVQYGLNGKYILNSSEKLIKITKVKGIKDMNFISLNCYISKAILNVKSKNYTFISFCSTGIADTTLLRLMNSKDVLKKTWINSAIKDTVIVYKVKDENEKYIFREFGFPHYITIDRTASYKGPSTSEDEFEILKQLELRYNPKN